MRRLPVVTWNSGVRSLPSTIHAPLPDRAASSRTTGCPSRSAKFARSCSFPSPVQVSVTPSAFDSALIPFTAR